MNSKTNRVTYYDWVRLIATIFVVIGHSAYWGINTTYGGIFHEFPENLSPFYHSAFMDYFQWLAWWVYRFHMELFFLLSGAVLGLRPLASFDKIVTSKFKRMIIPYFVWGACFMLPIKYLGDFYSIENFIPAYRNFLGGGDDSGHLWFLLDLFWCIIIFTILYKLLKHFNISTSFTLVIISLAIQLNADKFDFLNFYGLQDGLGYLFYFALGYEIELLRQNGTIWNMKKSIIAFIILFVIEYYEKRFDFLDGIVEVLAGIFLTLALAHICSKTFDIVTHNKLWNFIIRNLFYVYIFHDPLEYLVIKQAFGNDWLVTTGGCILYGLWRTVFIFVISLFLGEFVLLLKKLGKKILA